MDAENPAKTAPTQKWVKLQDVTSPKPKIPLNPSNYSYDYNSI